MKTYRRGVMLTLTALAALALPMAATPLAGADTAPDLTCGFTQAGPCVQTEHFTDDLEYLTPPPDVPSDCPSFIGTDVGVLDASGRGIEHINVDKAQDSWFTLTFTGEGTITMYPLSGAVFDNEGDVVAVDGAPDSAVPVYAGKVTEWIGGSFNNLNSDVTGTDDFELSANGQTLAVHVVFHAVWLPGADPNGPPTRTVDHVSCTTA